MCCNQIMKCTEQTGIFGIPRSVSHLFFHSVGIISWLCTFQLAASEKSPPRSLKCQCHRRWGQKWMEFPVKTLIIKTQMIQEENVCVLYALYCGLTETLPGWKAIQTNLCHNLFQILKHWVNLVSDTQIQLYALYLLNTLETGYVVFKLFSWTLYGLKYPGR